MDGRLQVSVSSETKKKLLTLAGRERISMGKVIDMLVRRYNVKSVESTDQEQ